MRTVKVAFFAVRHPGATVLLIILLLLLGIISPGQLWGGAKSGASALGSIIPSGYGCAQPEPLGGVRGAAYRAGSAVRTVGEYADVPPDVRVRQMTDALLGAAGMLGEAFGYLQGGLRGTLEEPMGEVPVPPDPATQVGYGGCCATTAPPPGGYPTSTTTGPLIAVPATYQVVAGNAPLVWSALRGRGLSEVHAAGVMGNMQVESGFDPLVVQGGGTSPNPADAGSGGYGLVQWTPGAKLVPLLHGAAPSIGSEVAALAEQLAPTGDEAMAGAALLATTTPEEAASVFGLRYERYAGPPQQVRSTNARAIYALYTGTEPTPGTQPAGFPTCTAPIGLPGGPAPSGPWHVDTSALPCPDSLGSIQQAPGGLSIKVCDVGGGILVNASIANNIVGMSNAMRAAGLTMAGGGWRSSAVQADLRRQHCPHPETDPASACSPPTAPVGSSEHEWGLAIDVDLAPGVYEWLNAHAAEYGMHNLPSEKWHWSVDGT